MSALGDEQRLAKMRAVWRAAAPDASQVTDAYQRFRRRRTEPRARHWSFELGLAAALAAGLLLVLGRGSWLDGSQSKPAGQALPNDVLASVPTAASQSAGAAEPPAVPKIGVWI